LEEVMKSSLWAHQQQMLLLVVVAFDYSYLSTNQIKVGVLVLFLSYLSYHTKTILVQPLFIVTIVNWRMQKPKWRCKNLVYAYTIPIADTVSCLTIVLSLIYAIRAICVK
jgi:hypothetical protein